MPIQIKKATRRHLKDLVDLYIESADEIYKVNPGYYKKGKETRRSYRSYVQDIMSSRSCLVLIALDGNQAVGYAIASIESRQFYMNQNYGWISDVYVNAQHRKKGISKKLMRYMLRWLREKGVKRVELFVDVKNTRAVKVWKKMGYKEHMKNLYRKL